MTELLPHPLTGQPFASPVPAGTGWPDDPAASGTPVAHDADDVRRLADEVDLAELDARVSVCSACDRLVQWREDVARDKRASFADQPYWGRPIAGWGAERPGVLIVGLAPAANGGNRTGRIFTGDRSGDWLFASLHRVGLASQPTSEHAGDGLRLIDTRMVATVRCAPPQNRPTTQERNTCSPWIEREISLVAPSVRVVVALGGYGWDAALRSFKAAGFDVPRPKPKFGHGAEALIGDRVTLLGCFHPSQQNTFTGKLTEEMTDAVFRRAATLV
ncbi:uracil-DNA glycosylase [Nocardioides sp. Soil797]|nr:uracil-DNA glycosylase [Nocardioides sp. Soil797]